MKIPFLIATALVHILLNSRIAGGQELTLKGDIPAIRATYNELVAFTNDLEEVVGKANAGAEEALKNCIFAYQAETQGMSLAGNSMEQLLKNPRLPNPATGFNISCRPFSGPISTVSIRFAERNFSIYELGGRDRVLLDVLQSRIDSFVRKQKTWLGGGTIRFVLFMLFIVFASGLVQGGIAQLQKGVEKGFGLFLAGCIVGILGFVFLIGGYFDSWFPSTAIYLGSASFMERNSAPITFWSFVLTLAGFLATVVALKLKE